MTLTLDPTSTAAQALPPTTKRRVRGVGRDPSVAIIVAVVVAVLLLLLGLPMSKLVMAAFSDEGLVVFTGLFTNPANLRVVGNTMLLGLLVGVCGTLVGFLFAFAQVRLKFRGKRLLHLLALVPVVAPPFAVATATITLFGRSGVVTSTLLGLNTDVYGLGGLVFVLTLSFSPVAYMNLKGMLENLDPSLDEAASDLGASKARIFFTVTLPMLAPGIAGSFLLLFVEGIADLANPLVLGGDYTVLSTRAYIAVTGEFNVQAGAAYSILLIVPALLVFLVQRYWTGKKQVTSVTGKPSGRAELITAPALRIPVLALVAAWVVVTITVYTTVVAGGFLKVPGVNNEFTLDHFRFVLAGIGSKAMLDTTVMALIAAPTAGVLGMLIAWLVVRKLGRFAGVLDFVGMLGLAVPGTVLGIGYAVAFLVPTEIFGFQILPPLAGGAAALGGGLAIVMVYITRSLPPGQRAGVAALAQINPAIDEASTSLGASGATTFRKVTLPLIHSAFATGITLATARAMTTLSPIVFLTTPGIKIMTSQILAEVDAGRFGNAFAYCALLVTIVLAIIGLINLLLRKVIFRGLLRH